MKTQAKTLSWGTHSLSWWLTLTIALGISFIGIRYMIDPKPASDGFGLPLPEDKTALYGSIKGIRDRFSGLVLLYLLWLKNARITAYIFTVAIIIPITDCLVILSANGPGDTLHLWIHGGTAIYCVLISILLFRENRSDLKIEH